jgi:hypothetical protein
MSNHTDNSPLLSSLRLGFEYLTGPFLGLILFVVTNNGFVITNNSVAPLIWALVGYVVGQHVVNAFSDEARKRLANEQTKQISNLITGTSDAFRVEMLSIFKVSHVRDSEINERIAASLRTAYHVRNTYVASRHITGTRTHFAAGIVEHYEIILAKDKNSSWQDIVGVGELLDGRFERINQSGKMDLKGSHEIYLINTHVPVLNFLLCGPRESEFTEVYFGWVRNTTTDVDVFYSRDERLISMFNNYFESLKRTKDRIIQIPFSYTDKPSERFNRSIPNRLCGTWLSVSGSVKTMSPANATPNADKGELATYAIINISYDEDWHATGRIYSYPDHKFKYNFKTDMCVLSENTIYYTYTNRNTFGRRESQGIGQYSIAQDSDALSGFYVRAGSNKSASLRAKKVGSGIANDPELINKTLVDVIAIHS